MRRTMVLVAVLACCQSAVGETKADSDKWQFQITPYIWLPTISGDLNYPAPPDGGSPGIDVGPTDWLELLNGVALLNGSMRKGRFSIFADFIYIGLESDNDLVRTVNDGPLADIDVNLSTKTNFDGASFALASGYTLKETDRSSVDVFAGVRYLNVEAKTTWNLSVDITTPGGGVVLPAQGSISERVEFWDGIVGFRGRHEFGESKWWVPWYADIGTGSSDLTWQAMAGLAYAFNWGDLMLVYRHLYYDEGSDGLMKDFSFSGPAFGARFRF